MPSVRVNKGRVKHGARRGVYVYFYCWNKIVFGLVSVSFGLLLYISSLYLFRNYSFGTISAIRVIRGRESYCLTCSAVKFTEAVKYIKGTAEKEFVCLCWECYYGIFICILWYFLDVFLDFFFDIFYENWVFFENSALEIFMSCATNGEFVSMLCIVLLHQANCFLSQLCTKDFDPLQFRLTGIIFYVEQCSKAYSKNARLRLQ